MDIIKLIDKRIESHQKDLRGYIPKVKSLNKHKKKAIYRTQIRIDELRRLKKKIEAEAQLSDNS